MKRFERFYPTGYVRPLGRGVTLTDKDGKTEYVDNVIEEMLSEDEYSFSGGSDLKNVHIVIEIDDAKAS